MTPSFSDRITNRNVLWSVALVAVVYLVTLLIMPREGLWIVDNENRLLQVQALADNGFSKYAIPWMGSEIDPGLEMSPLRFNPEGSFQEQKDGQLISVFQPTFLVISAVFYSLLGFWGLYILPFGSAVLLLVGVGRLAGALYPGRLPAHLAVLVTGLATPIWFYSQTFWEHTTAACLCVWGMVFVVRYLASDRRRDLATGFAFLVLAAFFRDVLGIFAVLVLALLVIREPKRWLATLLVSGIVVGFGAALLMLVQWITTGQPLGFHAGTLLGSESGLMGHLKDRPRLFYLFFCAAHPERALSLVMGAPFVIAFLWRPRFTAARFQSVVPWWALAALIFGSVYLVSFFTAANPLGHLLVANSFFFASPILILGFLRQREGKGQDLLETGNGLLLTAICLYLVLYCLMAPWAGAVSLHWGARPVLALYPLLAVPAAGTLARWWTGAEGKVAWSRALIMGLLLLVSVVGQVKSVHLLREKKAFTVELSQTVAKIQHPVVVTNVWWLGHEMYSVFFDKSIFFIQSQEQLDQLEAKLHARGFREFMYISRPQPGPAGPGIVRLEDGGWNFYSLDFVRAPVKAPRK